MAAPLDGKQLRHLRALAHDLKPIVQVGKNGVTDAVVKELDQALLAHELVKVKIGGESPADGSDLEARLGDLSATFVGQVGNVAIVYRRHPEKPRIELPRRERTRRADRGPGPRVD